MIPMHVKKYLGMLAGSNIKRKLGYGGWGAAYSTEDPRIVVKITRDPIEYRVNEKIRLLGLDKKLLGLPIIFKTFKNVFIYEPYDCQMHVIVRENIQPIKTSRNIYKLYDDLLTFSSLVADMQRSFSKRELSEKGNRDDFEMYREELAKTFDKLRYNRYSEHIIKVMEELEKHKISLGDVGPKNFGIRTFDFPEYKKFAGDYYVIFDLGFSFLRNPMV